MTNAEIKLKARGAAIPLWRIADYMKVSEATVSRKLRHELPEDEKQQFLEIIEALAAQD